MNKYKSNQFKLEWDSSNGLTKQQLKSQIEFLNTQNEYLKMSIDYHKSGVKISEAHLKENESKIKLLKSRKSCDGNVYTWNFPEE